MTERGIEEAEEALAREMLVFIQAAVSQILEQEDEGDFLAWVRAEAPRRLPGLFADLPNEQAARSISFEMGREIWNKIPLPGAGYRTRPIPRPERNEPCPCGSGQKHKRCCGSVAGGRFELPIDAEDGWTLVLVRMPEVEVAQLAADRRVPRALLPGIADRLIDFGRAETALALLEPLFEEPERLDERDGAAIEVLIDAYDELGLLESKERTVARLDEALRQPLRLVLWETLARSFLGGGDEGRAWGMVERIRRVDPESPVGSWVEVILLLGESRLAEASERAGEALSRPRTRASLSEEGLAWLQGAAEDASETRRRLMLGDLLPNVERFEKILVSVADRPIRPYAVATELNPAVGRIVTPEGLALIEEGWIQTLVNPGEDSGDEEPDWEDEDDWAEAEAGTALDEGEEEEGEGGDGEDLAESVWEYGDPDDEEEEDFEEVEEDWGAGAEAWLAYLEENPEAFDSLLVLSDLVLRASSIVTQRDVKLRDAILAPVVRRGIAILDASLAGAPGVTLPAAQEENLPALEVLHASAFQVDEPVPDLAPLERLLQLDPDDELRARNDLGTIYLWHGEPQKTLDLAARFPEDEEPYLSYAKVIALRQLGLQKESLEALDDALDAYPMTGEEIAQANPAFPESLLQLWQEDEELGRMLNERLAASLGE